MYFRKNEEGFSAVELVLIIVLASIIGATTWYVMKANKNIKKTSDDTVASSAITPSKSTKSSGSKPTTAQKYLVIKEWSVKFPYDGDDTLSYKITGSDSAEIISKNLADMYYCTDFGAGIISREKGSDQIDGPSDNPPTVAQDASQHPDAYGHVGEYYYHAAHDQAACWNGPKAGTVDADKGLQAQNAANALTAAIVSKVTAN